MSNPDNFFVGNNPIGRPERKSDRPFHRGCHEIVQWHPWETEYERAHEQYYCPKCKKYVTEKEIY